MFAMVEKVLISGLLLALLSEQITLGSSSVHYPNIVFTAYINTALFILSLIAALSLSFIYCSYISNPLIAFADTAINLCVL